MNILFKKLPLEIVIYILEYTNVIKYRNGKFIDRINLTDERYLLLNNFTPIQRRVFGNYSFKYIRIHDKSYISLYIRKDNNITKYTYTYAKKTEKNKVGRPIYIYQTL